MKPTVGQRIEAWFSWIDDLDSTPLCLGMMLFTVVGFLALAALFVTACILVINLGGVLGIAVVCAVTGTLVARVIAFGWRESQKKFERDAPG